MPYSTWVSLSPISFLYRKRTGWSTSTSFISRGTDGNLCLNEFYSCMTLRVNIESFLNILAFLIDFMLLFPSRLVYSTVKVSHFFIFSFQAAKLVNFKVVLKWSSPDFLKVFYSFFFAFLFWGFPLMFTPVLLPGHFRGLFVCLLRQLTLTYESFSFKINLKLYLWGLCYYQLVTKTQSVPLYLNL